MFNGFEATYLIIRIFEREEDRKFIMTQIDKLEEYIARNRYQDLPRLLIHGDYRFCNMVFTDNQRFIRWDLLQYAPRVLRLLTRAVISH